MSESNSGLPKDAKGWLDYASKIDLKDRKGAALSLGIVAVAGLGLGAYKLSKRHGNKDVNVGYADRRYEQAGVVSVVETGRDGKFAIGVPHKTPEQSEEFSMDDDGGYIVRPSKEGYSDRHGTRLRKAREWVVDILTQRANAEDQPPQQVPEA